MMLGLGHALSGSVKWVEFLSLELIMEFVACHFVEMLILYDLWAGGRLVLEKALPRHRRPGHPISVCVHLLQFFNVCDHNVSTAFNAHPRNIPGKIFWTELMLSRQLFIRNRVIFDHCSKRYYWSVKWWYPEPPFKWCFPIRQEILNVSQISVTFHGIRPPFIVET